MMMRWLSQYMGSTTHSRLDRAVIARYFAFLVISQLIIFTLIGVIFSKWYGGAGVEQVTDEVFLTCRLRKGNYW